MDAVIQELNGTEGENTEHRSATLLNKAEYRHLCAAEPSIPIFSNAWWLDAVAGPAGWDVALAKANGRIVGAMPFCMTRRYGMKVIQQPPLTPVLGPWIRGDQGTPTTRLSNQQKIMQSLIEHSENSIAERERSYFSDLALLQHSAQVGRWALSLIA